jgi:hypothetical protein
MHETLPDEELPSMSLPRKGPAAEEPHSTESAVRERES